MTCWRLSTLCIFSLEVLFRELESRQTALRHFIQYLSETGEQEVLLQLLGSVSVPLAPVSPARCSGLTFLLLLLLRALGRTEEAAVCRHR